MNRSVLASLAAALAATVAFSGLAAPSPSHAGNPTGRAAGSPPNGTGSLSVKISPTADGRIAVRWRPNGKATPRRYVVEVGPSRRMDRRVERYRLAPRKRRTVVEHAADAVPASGNFSFVRVRAFYRHGKTSSPLRWIQAPLGARCTVPQADRLRVGSFNVRTWAADRSRGPLRSWAKRGPRVIKEIRASGARVLAMQEAGGGAKKKYGGRTQDRWILDRLNRADRGARWVDALTKDHYKPPKGRKPGLVGTRVFYDASRFQLLDRGLERLVVPGWPKDSLVPWARLRARDGSQAPFVITSHHLRVGPSRAARRVRVAQTQQTIGVVRGLRARFGDTVVVAGDLNSTANDRPRNEVQARLLAAGMYDAFATARLRGSAWPTANRSKYPVPKTPLRRDYILTLGPVPGSCAYVNRVYQRKRKEASDHFMQVAVLPLPPA